MLEFTVFNPNQYFQRSIEQNTIRIGSDPTPGKNHLVIEDPLVSQTQFLLEPLESNGTMRLKITNLGGSMVLGRSLRLHHLASTEVELPCILGAGDSVFQITNPEAETKFDHALQQMDPIGSSSEAEHSQPRIIEQSSPSPETLSSWFEALGAMQRSTAGESSFFTQAARSVFNPGGMDGCIILMSNDSQWNVVAQHIPYPFDGIHYRKELIDKVLEIRKPVYHENSQLNSTKQNDSHAAVVCPVFDNEDEITAIIYGFRNSNSAGSRRGIRDLEAKFVNLLADSIAAGMIRLEHEANRARQRVLLEQAFSPEVVRHLETNPDILNGQEKEVTVLFADLRGFCKISESIGASTTYQLLTDVLDRFTKIVQHHRGVIIDFYGDGLAAFWNAPVEQPNHPLLACQAGSAICDVMNEINRDWSTAIGRRMRVGVGIHTGIAQVGNSGSQNRLKYGPQGTTVNIASRLEQATKKLGVDLVVSSATANCIDDQFVPTRICTLQLAGIQEPISAMMLVDPIDFAKHGKQFERYSRGLELFEAENYVDSVSEFTSIDDSGFCSLPLEFILKELNLRMGHDMNEPVKPLATVSTNAICVS